MIKAGPQDIVIASLRGHVVHLREENKALRKELKLIKGELRILEDSNKRLRDETMLKACGYKDDIRALQEEIAKVHETCNMFSSKESPLKAKMTASGKVQFLLEKFYHPRSSWKVHGTGESHDP